mmetsp:Transcript_17923/g.27412  ORF Transcript_17923/g.27412 Transcript_17923/m.27412 type:complete len:262 (+) Transcript_17923:88-873(+)
MAATAAPVEITIDFLRSYEVLQGKSSEQLEGVVAKLAADWITTTADLERVSRKDLEACFPLLVANALKPEQPNVADAEDTAGETPSASNVCFDRSQHAVSFSEEPIFSLEKNLNGQFKFPGENDDTGLLNYDLKDENLEKVLNACNRHAIKLQDFQKEVTSLLDQPPGKDGITKHLWEKAIALCWEGWEVPVDEGSMGGMFFQQTIYSCFSTLFLFFASRFKSSIKEHYAADQDVKGSKNGKILYKSGKETKKEPKIITIQ